MEMEAASCPVPAGRCRSIFDLAAQPHGHPLGGEADRGFCFGWRRPRPRRPPESGRSSRSNEFEYERLDTGVFEENRYFEVFVSMQSHFVEIAERG